MKKEIYRHKGLWYFDLNWEEKRKSGIGTLIKKCGFHSCPYDTKEDAKDFMALRIPGLVSESEVSP